MDCVYVAVCNYMRYLGEPLPNRWQYEIMKLATHASLDVPTWGGVVPWIVHALCGWNVAIQHHVYTKAHYLYDVGQDMAAESDDEMLFALSLRREVVRVTDFGEEVEKITLEPAIYLQLSYQHAVFAERVPEGVIVMAIQIRKETTK